MCIILTRDKTAPIVITVLTMAMTKCSYIVIARIRIVVDFPGQLKWPGLSNDASDDSWANVAELLRARPHMILVSNRLILNGSERESK
jgi:hypothetical protein